MISDKLEHRRFLKVSTISNITGEYIPDVITQDSKEISLAWLKNSKYGSAIFFISKNCSACDMEVVHETCTKHPEFSYAIFCEGYDEEFVSRIQSNYYDSNVKVYSYETKYIREQLKVTAVPYMLILNKIGQVIGENIINTYIHSYELLKPLLRSVNR